MALRTIEYNGQKTYVFEYFWDFVVLCVRTHPWHTLRAFTYAIVGWLIGAGFGILAANITWKWVIGQVLILLALLAACSAITIASLRKEWDYLTSTNLLRKVPKED